MSQSEIATELQMPLGTVKTRNRAALLHLAEILEREEHAMSEQDLEALERRLRTLPPLLDVPPSLVAPSVRGRVREPDRPRARFQRRADRRMVAPLVVRRRRRSPRPR